MKIMITGASGFVGSYLCEQMMVCGHDVIAVVRNQSEPSMLGFIPDKVYQPKTIISLDFINYDAVEMAMSKYKPDIIIHAGAQSIVRKSVETPKQTIDVNVLGTTNLLEACRVANKGLKLFHYFSTDKVYGALNCALEQDPYLPTCPYSASKISSEIIAKSYEITYGIPLLITRSCNIYGGDFNKRVIPNTIREVLHGYSATVFEDDNKMFRQYIYISDLCTAVSFLIEGYIKGNLSHRIYNIGGVGQNSTEEIVSIIAGLGGVGTRILPKYDSLKEINSQSVDIKRILGEGWDPIFDIKEGLKKTFNWYVENLPKIERMSKA